MRFSQPLMVLGLAGAVAALGIGFVAFRSANSHQEIMLGALQRGMERAYDQAVAGVRHSETQEPLSLPSSALRNVFLDVREPVPITSNGLVCVVRLGDTRLYGITGRRSWRKVGLDEFSRWPHEPLTSDVPIAR
jgi:hypothetical protein